MKTRVKYIVWLLIFFATEAKSQMMNDGVFMAKNSFCFVLGYQNDSWSKYWEGGLYRENKNIGTLTTQSLALMGNYGISNKFNLLFSLPYISVNASVGTSQAFQGLQDLTAALKYRLYQIQNLSIIGAAGGSIPTNSYVADYMPFTIGNQSKTAFARSVFYYTLPKNLAITAHGTYTIRSNVELDRNMYYSERAVFTNQMTMPTVFSFGAKAGHYSYRWQLEATYEQQFTNGNQDIRRNDMPMLNNRFDFQRIGFISSVRIPQLNDLQIGLSANKIIAGRNVGESINYSFMLSKIIDFRKQKTEGNSEMLVCRPGELTHKKEK
jgi:hypothetical protein